MGKREGGREKRDREREEGRAGKIERERLPDKQTGCVVSLWGEVELGARERERYRKERGGTGTGKSVGTQAHGSRFAVHGSPFTVHDSRFTVHDPNRKP